jgi:hypothetical protein
MDEPGSVQQVQIVSVQSKWTLDTLKDFFDARITDLKTTCENSTRALDDRISADIAHAKDTAAAAQKTSQQAIDKAEAATATRFESFNEFNERMNKVTSDSFPRESFQQFNAQYTAYTQATDKRFTDLAAQYAADKSAVEIRFSQMVGKETGISTQQQATQQQAQTNRSQITMIAIVAGTVAAIVMSILTSFVFHTPAQTAPQFYVPAAPGTLLPSAPPQTTPR